MESDWKLKLRYGKIQTPFRHFTVLAEGRMENPNNEFDCPVGMAWMAMKTWAEDSDESGRMIQVFGKHFGFQVTGEIQVYETEALQPPEENPSGYDINFSPFDNTQ